MSNMPRLITAGSPLEFKVPHFQTMAGSLFVMSGSSRKPPGWWFQPTPLKNHGVKVSWDDDIPNGKNIIQSCSSHHQAEQSIFEWLEAKLWLTGAFYVGLLGVAGMMTVVIPLQLVSPQLGGALGNFLLGSFYGCNNCNYGYSGYISIVIPNLSLSFFWEELWL